MAGNPYLWSTTAATNSASDSDINFVEGQLPSTLNDSSRAVMAGVAGWLKDTNSTLTTGGSANAQTVTSNVNYAALATGIRLHVKAGFSNTAAATLNLTPAGGGAFGVKAIKVIRNSGEADLVANQIRANGHYILEYDTAANAAAGAWILLNPSVFTPWTLTLITSTNATWPVPAGTKAMIIEVWGAGGSGCGTDGTNTYRGVGGGGGAYVFKYYAGTMDTTLAVTIGAGGTSASGTNGVVGGTSTVVGANLGTLSAGGGLAANAFTGFQAGAGGGAASGGDLNITGGSGSSNTGPAGQTYGFGGNSPRGGMGGRANVGEAGGVPGGGGAGENNSGGGSGAGGNGRVLIWTS